MYSSRISSAMLILDSFTSSANGACGRQERHDSAGIRLLTAASGWRSNPRKSTSPVQRQAGQRAHRNQCREAMAAAIVGENSMGILAAWRSFQALISRFITEPNSFVAEVHDRMPVLLNEKDYEPWLSGAAGTELLKPAAEDLLQRWPVSKRVNSSRAPDDDPTLIEPIGV